MKYREARLSDIPAIARIRLEGGWEGGAPEERMARYLEGTHHPQGALAPRVILVASEDDDLVGFIAGHLTRRFGCDGELQWIFVSPAHRRRGVGSALVDRLAEWFVARGASRVCVDVGAENAGARRFYERHGAADLREHWMAWDDVGAARRRRDRP